MNFNAADFAQALAASASYPRKPDLNIRTFSRPYPDGDEGLSSSDAIDARGWAAPPSSPIEGVFRGERE